MKPNVSNQGKLKEVVLPPPSASRQTINHLADRVQSPSLYGQKALLKAKKDPDTIALIITGMIVLLPLTFIVLMCLIPPLQDVTLALFGNSLVSIGGIAVYMLYVAGTTLESIINFFIIQ